MHKKGNKVFANKTFNPFTSFIHSQLFITANIKKIN